MSGSEPGFFTITMPENTTDYSVDVYNSFGKKMVFKMRNDVIFRRKQRSRIFSALRHSVLKSL
ncbi:MAG: hypothetical protein V4642_04680 [Bacteroidota bacterium]